MTAAEKVIATARAEVGYLEKATNSQLDDKTANAGNNNFTKYARDLDAIGNIYNGGKNGYAWCDVFVDWCFIQTFGVENAMKLLCQPYGGGGAGCKYSAQYYQNKGQFHTSSPQAGDQIFFLDSAGKPCHTGLVSGVGNGKVSTIEGNTSSASGVVANGGCVREKSYSLTYKLIYGYGRPDWTLAGSAAESVNNAANNTAKSVCYTAKVTANDGLNCRSKASTSGSIVTTYPKGTVVTITQEQNGWGYTGAGWVSLQYVEKIAQETSPTATTAAETTTETEDEDMDVNRFKELWLEMRKDLQDNDANAYSQEARDWAVGSGLIQGGSTDEFNGMWQDFMTREQLVTVLYRFAQQMGKV